MLRLLLLLATLTPLTHADVLTVGAAGGDFATLQGAIDAALDGDVLLLADEPFAGATLTDKELTIVADSGASPRVHGELTIQGLSAGKSCLISGLTLESGVAPGIGQVFVVGLRIELNAGAVFVEDCAIRGRGVAFGTTVRFSESVSFVDCELTGFNGSDCFDAELCVAGEGVPALFVRSSKVAVSNSFLEGGRGGSYVGDFQGVPADGGDGGDAIEFANGQLHVAASELNGGSGGGGNCSPSGCGSNGSSGRSIRMTSFGASLSLQQALLSNAIVNPEGAPIVEYSARARSLSGAAPVREGETLSLTFAGQQDDQVSLWISFDAGFLAMPTRQGVFQLGVPLALSSGVGLGTLPVSGQKQVDLLVPAFPGLEGFPLFLQGVFVSPSEGVLLGTPTATVALSAAF